MRHLLAVPLLAAGLAGCHGPWKHPGHTPYPSACYPSDRPHPQAHCPPAPCPPRAEGQPTEEVVYAPRQKVIVESPPPTHAPAAPQACAPPCVPPPPAAAPQPSFAPQPQAFAQPMMPAPMMPVGYGQGYAAAAPVGATVRERTGIAFELTSIRIPIPFIRPIAVQRPAEVSFQMPVQQPAFAPVAMAPAAMPVMSMGQPMAFAPQMQMQAPGAQVMMVPQASVGYGQVTVQHQVPYSQVTAVQTAGAAQVTAPVAVVPAPVAVPAATSACPDPKQLEEELRKCQEKLKELEALKGQKPVGEAPAPKK